MAAAAILDFQYSQILTFARVRSSNLRHSAKFYRNRLVSIWILQIFCTFNFKTLIRVPNLGYLGDTTLYIRCDINRSPRRHIFKLEDVIRRIDRHKIGPSMRPVGATKKPEKADRMKPNWQTGYSPRPPMSSDRNAVWRGGCSSGGNRACIRREVSADWLLFLGCLCNLLLTCLFSYLRILTTWHCPRSSTACRCCSNWSIAPSCRAYRSRPAAAGLLVWACAGTDRRTDTVPFHRSCSAYYAAVPIHEMLMFS